MGKALYNVAPIENNPHFAYFSFIFGFAKNNHCFVFLDHVI